MMFLSTLFLFNCVAYISVGLTMIATRHKIPSWFHTWGLVNFATFFLLFSWVFIFALAWKG